MTSANLPVPLGICANAVRNVPATWSAAWFQRFITAHLQNADYRNAIAGAGISITAPGGEQNAGEISLGGAPYTAPIVLEITQASAPGPAIETAVSGGGNIFGMCVTAPAGDFAGISLAGNGTAFHSTDFEVYQSGSSVATLYNGANAAMQFFTDGVLRFQITNGGQVVVESPSVSNNAFEVTASADNFAGYFLGSSTSGQSFGVQIQAGTTTADYALEIVNEAASLNLFLVQGAGAVFFPEISTTSSSANAFVNSSSSPKFSLLESTSSIRFKKDIENLAESDVILKLRPVRFHSKCAADDPTKWNYGLIAEEVAAIDPSLVTFEKPGVPRAVQYDRIAVLLLPIVQKMYNKLYGETA